MLITRLKLKNWRNFKNVEINLRERVYVIGPNASGKSNLLDALRFLRDIAKPEGGGLQKAVKERGGIKKVRCLLARKDPVVLIEVELAEKMDADPVWRYTLSFRSEGKGQQRLVVSREYVEDLRNGKVLLDRPNDSDRTDTDRTTQTYLEQINTNGDFRVMADFFAAVNYLHLVPQLLKHADQLGGYRLESDPFGRAFLERIAKTTEKTLNPRLAKIGEILKVCVPNMSNLRFVRDEATGTPHLEALYEDIVRQIHPLIWRMQRQAKYRRQIFVTTHSEALLQDKGIDPREVIRLEPSRDGTRAIEISDTDKALISAGYSIAETILPKVRPSQVNQLSLFIP